MQKRLKTVGMAMAEKMTRMIRTVKRSALRGIRRRRKVAWWKVGAGKQLGC